MFVSGVVIDDEMDVEGVGHIAVDLTQESEELLMTVSRMTTGDDFAGGDIESGEQPGGAVAFIVMSDAFEGAEAHGEDGLSSLESLNRGLFIDREHDGVVGGIEVETDDVADFLDEEGAVGNLEMPLAVGLEADRSNHRWTVLLEIPLWRAMERTLQCEPWGGWVCRAVWMTSATRSSSWVRGRPGRSSSWSPLIPWSR